MRVAERLCLTPVMMLASQRCRVWALYDYPVVKRFLTRPEGSGLKEQFYELYNEVRQDYNTINTILERGDQDEFNSLYPKIESMMAVKNDVYFIRKQLSLIRQDKKAIMRSDMDSDQRKYMLDQLAAQENEIPSRLCPSLSKPRKGQQSGDMTCY